MGLNPTSEDVKERISNSCNKRFLLYDAIETFIICSQQYLNETQSKILNQSSNIIKTTADLACENNGLTIFKLRTYDSESCRTKLKKSNQSCDLSNESSFYGFMNDINERQCNSINDVKSFVDCYALELRTLCSDFFSIVYRKIFDIIFDVIHIENKCATESE